MSRKPIPKKEISQEWLVTYSDMMTLVLTFFVLLYSFSLLDTNKFKAVAISLANALQGKGNSVIFDYNNQGNVPIVGEEIPEDGVDNLLEIQQDEEGGMYDKVTEFVSENNLNEFVTIREGSRGVIIEFKDKILFDSGRANIKQDGIPVLNKISELIGSLPNKMVIEGHTDNVPIHTAQFPSNWELSSARALSVLRYLADVKGISQDRLSFAAYGEYSPIASNDTPQGRAQNRRVNILILAEKEGS